jgi:membrane-associated phospholipid phosphatase
MTDVNYILFRLINGVWAKPVLDLYMIFLSLINDYGLVWLLLLAVLAALGDRTGRRAALAGLVTLVAGVISYSRVYVGVHYPGDVLGGTLLRLLIGWLAAFMVNRRGKHEAFRRLISRRRGYSTTPATEYDGHCMLLIGSM